MIRSSSRAASPSSGSLPHDPRWYKDAIIYELHVRAFMDSDGNGIGDFQGLTSRLDYLADLGITAIWLLPFYPSPGRDDGYDIADYRQVNPDYGTLRDVRTFVREAHRRGLRVITELVCNHTSDQHPWFQRARHAPPGSSYRNFYVWSDTADRYPDARIIFKDYETSNWTWDPVAGAYYWHRFFSHQPDLNFDNPRVREAVLQTLDYWLDMGIDGIRLDAIPYLYERDGTNGENLPETHAFLADLRRHVDERYGDRMLLAEANQWPEEAVQYLGTDERPECHMAFHFPVMPRLFMSIRMEDRFPILDILDQTPSIPDAAQWAMFLRNHDELTLEMVTDEERDFMYRAYASDPQARINLGIRRRLAPLLGNNRRRIELMNGLLFSLPGTPVIYYGDEIGMGDNVYLGDRNGVRTPMQWSPDRNAGFSTANRQRLYLPPIVDPEYHHEAVNVDAQLANPHSLLWWMRRLIALRRRHPAFGQGTIAILNPENRKVLAFVRRHEHETLLIVANLSRYVQWTSLDLSLFIGMKPVELFGSVEFPPIEGPSYPITLGPHAFYWFQLRPGSSTGGESGTRATGTLERPRTLTDLTSGRAAGELNARLVEWVAERRWFRGRGRRIRTSRIADLLPIPGHERTLGLLLFEVTYSDGEPEMYSIPVAIVDDSAPEREDARLIARLIGDHTPAGYLVDAAGDPEFVRALISLLTGKRRFPAGSGSWSASRPAPRPGSRAGTVRRPRSSCCAGSRPTPRSCGVSRGSSSCTGCWSRARTRRSRWVERSPSAGSGTRRPWGAGWSTGPRAAGPRPPCSSSTSTTMETPSTSPGARSRATSIRPSAWVSTRRSWTAPWRRSSRAAARRPKPGRMPSWSGRSWPRRSCSAEGQASSTASLPGRPMIPRSPPSR